MLEATVNFEGRLEKFEVANLNDHIQVFHRRGCFYEPWQVLAHRDLILMPSR